MKPVAILTGAVLSLCCLSPGGIVQARPGDTALLPDIVGTAQFYAADPNSGLALNGRDPVSYQIDGRPRSGGASNQTVWSGLGWRFSNAANRAAFMRSPEAFAPRIGGYDAEAAAEGRLVEADPEIFVVQSGRLYFFRTEAARARFVADPGRARRAEAHWPALQSVLVRG